MVLFQISMEERLRKLLVNLPTDGVELCTLYFTSQVLDEAHNQAAKDERVSKQMSFM